MLPTQSDFEGLLGRLRRERTESPIYDGKANLLLDKDGDKAYLIRHIAALANNVQPSFMILGVENKTWLPSGHLSTDSPLVDPDETQHRINSILGSRLDPSLSIRYGVYQVEDSLYGLIVVEGRRAPYIVAIEPQQYGGDRTHGAPSYIHKGAIYIRRGANTVIANRHSDIQGIIDLATMHEDNRTQVDDFLVAAHYDELDSDTFGRHELSDRLVELVRSDDAPKVEVRPAKSWVAFVFSPSEASCTVDTVELKKKLQPDSRIGRGADWYRGIPRSFADMFYHAVVTPREFRGTWGREGPDDTRISKFFRIVRTGHVEVACTHPLFSEYLGCRYYHFVCLIGCLWQLSYLVQAIYGEAEYHGDVSVLVNLVGAGDTLLDGYARPWLSIFNPGSFDLRKVPCMHSNVQITRQLPLADSSGEQIEAMIRDIASELGSYYGQEQERPKCFTPDHGEFPAREYQNRCQ